MSLIAATIAGVLAYKAGGGGTSYLAGCDVLGAELSAPAPVTVVVQQQPLTWTQSWVAGLTAGLTVAIITHYWRRL